MKVKSSQSKQSVRATGTSQPKRGKTAFVLSSQPVAGDEPSQESPKYDIGAPPRGGSAEPEGGKVDAPQFASDVATSSPETPAYEDLGSLPASYGLNSLYLVARDPHWLFCYWDLNWDAMRDVVRNTPVYLRLMSEDGEEIDRALINPHAPNWYLPAPGQGAAYFVELGYEVGDQPWHCLCQSDLAFVPVQAMIENASEVFATVPLHLSFQRLLDTVQDAMRSGESLLNALARFQGADGLPVAFGAQESWSADQKKVLEALLGREVVERISVGSGEFDKVLREDLERSLSSETSSGLSARALRLPEMSPTSLSSGFGSGFGASWSAQPFSQQQERGFFMHVNAEVIFYGGTHPDAKVTIDGKPITLSPDGSFRYHFIFPDETYEIPIVAVSPDGVEQRSAVLKLERATSRQGDVGHTAQPPELSKPMGRK